MSRCAQKFRVRNSLSDQGRTFRVWVRTSSSRPIRWVTGIQVRHPLAATSHITVLISVNYSKFPPVLQCGFKFRTRLISRSTTVQARLSFVVALLTVTDSVDLAELECSLRSLIGNGWSRAYILGYVTVVCVSVTIRGEMCPSRATWKSYSCGRLKVNK